MKASVKLLLVLLIIAMLCPIIVSCANNDKGNDDDDATTTAAKEEESGFVSDNLNQYNLDFQQEVVNVLNWKAEKDEFFIENTDGTKVNDAIWTRNDTIERRLNVQLEFHEEEGSNTYRKEFIQYVENQRGQNTHDIIASYSRVAGTLSIRGLYTDLNTIEQSYFDFSKPWWPETLINTVTIGDSLYFVSGDASTNVLHFMYTIYFNKDLKASYTDIEDDFYDLVNSQKWTLNKLIEFASDKYEDLDNDGKGASMSATDLDDKYGFCTIYYGLDAFYTGSGLKLAVQDEDKLIKLSDDYTSTKAIDLVEKLHDFVTGPDCSTFTSSGQYRQPFVNGNALFCQERAYLATNYLGEATFKYGILPTPKYNNSQKDYITIVGNPFTLYGISSDCDAETASHMTAVLECWGSEGYRQTTPALFEETMKARYAEAPEDAVMWDTIRRTACFDLGRIFSSDEMGGTVISEAPSNTACASGNWGAVCQNKANGYKTQLEIIAGKYAALQAG